MSICFVLVVLYLAYARSLVTLSPLLEEDSLEPLPTVQRVTSEAGTDPNGLK